MHHNFQCSHHCKELVSQKQKNKLFNSDQRINNAVTLLQSTFISPYKIMYLLEPKQADYFKNRNQAVGCCSSNYITISDSECTRTERLLKQFISYSFLVQNIDKILSYCSDRFQNIITSGKKDNLDVTDEAQKYILDKVFMESVNNYIYLKLSEQIQKDSINLNKEIGLWATPATWFQKYPNIPLNSIPNQLISDLSSKHWSMQSKYFQNSKEQIKMQLTLLQKDGKFQSSSWSKQSQGEVKMLNNPQLYSEIMDSRQQYLFSSLRQIVILFSSFPFELNYKANLFCTINSNSHIYFCKRRLLTKEETGQLQYTVLANFGRALDIIINQQKHHLQQGSLLFLNSSKTKYSIHAEGQENLFILRNQIGCVPKK